LESLHDAWVESIEIREPATGPRNEVRVTDLTIRLLGPLHDRRHELLYRGVTRYSVDARSVRHGHGDLIVHEFRLGDNGLVEHELLFDDRASIEVHFAGFEHRMFIIEDS
jgi:hypothetical protein